MDSEHIYAKGDRVTFYSDRWKKRLRHGVVESTHVTGGSHEVIYLVDCEDGVTRHFHRYALRSGDMTPDAENVN